MMNYILLLRLLIKKQQKNETGILTVSLSTFNDKDEKVFEGDLSVLIKR